MAPSLCSELQQLLQQYVNIERYKLDISVLQRCLQSVESHQVYQLIQSVQGRWNATVIHEAAFRGHQEVIRCILEFFTEKDKYELLTTQNVYQSTPLHYSAIAGNVETTTCIMNSIAPEKRCELMKVLTKESKNTPLHWAIGYRHGHTELFRCLLSTMSSEDVCEVMKEQNIRGNTPLHYAAWKGSKEPLKYLLDCLTPGNQIQLLNTINKDGRTPLDVAAHYNQTDAVKLIRKYKSSAERYLREAQGKWLSGV